jgi:hypothetical protein
LPVSSAAGAAWVAEGADAPPARPVSSSRREKAKVFNTSAGIPEPIPDAQALRIKNPLPAFNHKYVMLHRNGIKQAPC